MNIVDVCRIKYPGQIELGNISFRQEWHDSPIEVAVWNVPDVTQPTEASLLAEIPSYQDAFNFKEMKASVSSAVTSLVESKAVDRGYQSGISLCTYVNSTNAAWQLEATTFIAWRDSVWIYCEQELTKYENNLRAIVSVEEFLAELPALVWPN